MYILSTAQETTWVNESLLVVLPTGTIAILSTADTENDVNLATELLFEFSLHMH